MGVYLPLYETAIGFHSYIIDTFHSIGLVYLYAHTSEVCRWRSCLRRTPLVCGTVGNDSASAGGMYLYAQEGCGGFITAGDVDAVRLVQYLYS